MSAGAKKRRAKVASDPIFAAEMDALARNRHAAFSEGFSEEWSKVANRQLRPVSDAQLHRHEPDCFAGPIVKGIVSVSAREAIYGDGKLCRKMNMFVEEDRLPRE